MTKKNSQKNTIISATIVALVLVGLFIYIGRMHTGGEINGLPAIKGIDSTKPQSGKTVQSNIYTNPSFGFSFATSTGETVQDVIQDETDTVLINKAGIGIVAQIYITPFDGVASDITQKNIEKDTGIKISNWKSISLPKNKISAVMFTNNSDNPATAEVWFINDGSLYQITASNQATAELNNLLATLEFK